ncbi:UDP-N-acetylmuramoyl-tripeptide--D-alanyl-D-alanine ligase [uncultured Maribacter sp.]|uniref:UDP-N-acetylmuramoyl-tripeptide--D-alanyl-D- alanine ligase n=1 Tax=uncultured Maribacter sp. TaxID=431308 RepID=UPI002628700A|nr:UDP-N-acetylmuramoyl-tripeptide--D-alanyl-D-alanine ligase [uncultured Maribacter sp.]
MTIEELHSHFLRSFKISTDTRKINDNSIFFALKGEKFNGNLYAEEAISQGAHLAIVDEDLFPENDNVILVKDALNTLQQLANFHRQHCKAKVISITGSNGKTTTKELIHTVLKKQYKTIATKGNLNNHIGVPLTLLSIKKNTEIAIVEMGANHKEEIAFLCSIAEPDYGYITNFGKAHLEGFGGIEGVIQGKSELYNYLTTNQKQVFLNADDPIQKNKLSNYIKKYGFSQKQTQYYTIELLSSNPFVTLKVENNTIESQLIGKYNFTNCCAAIITGKYFSIPLPQIKDAIEGYVPENNRSQIIKKKGYKIILDAYNANPTSMIAALENFNNIKEDNKVLFLGDMFELGSSSNMEHQNIADIAQELNFKSVYLIGENFYQTRTSLKKFATFENLKTYLKQNKVPKKSSLLIKGSRGMALERILDVL